MSFREGLKTGNDNRMSNHFWQDRRVFVTGCTGLLGSWLTAALRQAGAQVVGLVRDLTPHSQLVRAGDSMALALNALPVQQPGERMYAPDAIHHWREMLDCAMPDVVILDLPPLLEDAVMPALMPQLDAVLLVADGLSSTARDILECERILDGQVPLLGIVLNKSEDRDPRRSPRRR